MKLSKQMLFIIAIILVGIVTASFILRSEEPKAEANAEHVEEGRAEHEEHA